MQSRLGGIWPAVASPCDADGVFLEDAFAELVMSLYRTEIAGLYVCGSTGDGKRMRLQERKRAAEIAVELSRTSGGKVILHVGAECTRDAVELTTHGAQAGVDAISSLVPAGCSHSQAVNYYTTIARASQLPVVIYHMPLFSHVATFDEALEMLDIEGVVGMKFSDWDLFFMQRAIRARPDIVVFSGFDELLCLGLLYGAHGGIGTWYNLLPDVFVEIHKTVRRGDIARAVDLQTRLNSFLELGWQFGLRTLLEYLMRNRVGGASLFRAPHIPGHRDLMEKVEPVAIARMAAIEEAM